MPPAKARIEAGLRQADLAKLVGLPQPIISKIEMGERGADVVELRSISQALGLSIAELVDRFEACIARSGTLPLCHLDQAVDQVERAGSALRMLDVGA